MKTIFITGVARGLGHELFRYALERGHRVFGLVRTEASFAQLQAYDSRNAVPVLADLTDDSCIEKIRAVTGDEPIDLLRDPYC